MVEAAKTTQKTTIAEMREFIGELCFAVGIRGEKVPSEATIAMPKSDLETFIAIRNFFDRIEPYADEIREIVRRGSGRGA